ncbi:MAG: hypothetical protein AAF456_19305 [Planctomycetota bacterium]
MTEQGRSPVDRYFAGLAESTFQTQLGVVDPPLIDYVSNLLIRFIRSDVVHRLRSVTGQPLMSVPEMIAEASSRLGDAQREIHQHIGDFTLFWAGVYPEALRRESTRFESYCSEGRRAYRIASSIQSSDENAPESGVLHRMSDNFDLCCYGLREVRRQWEDGDGLAPGSILLN